ncbi:MAG: hypothetical protein ACP5D2_02885 [Candidatus Nanoarchaeia archaeon]
MATITLEHNERIHRAELAGNPVRDAYFHGMKPHLASYVVGGVLECGSDLLIRIGNASLRTEPKIYKIRNIEQEQGITTYTCDLLDNLQLSNRFRNHF